MAGRRQEMSRHLSCTACLRDKRPHRRKAGRRGASSSPCCVTNDRMLNGLKQQQSLILSPRCTDQESRRAEALSGDQVRCQLSGVSWRCRHGNGRLKLGPHPQGGPLPCQRWPSKLVSVGGAALHGAARLLFQPGSGLFPDSPKL